MNRPPIAEGVIYEDVLRPYADRWRVRRQEDGIYVLVGRYATIQPYSINGHWLVAACDFRNARHMNSILRRITAAGLSYEITQQGDMDVAFKFSNEEKNLRLLRPFLGLIRKKRMSTASLQNLRKTTDRKTYPLPVMHEKSGGVQQ